MKTKEFEKLERDLAIDLPGLTIKGNMMFVPPLESILRGIAFEGSDFDRTSFYVTVFALPLFVPTTHLHFLLSDRLRNNGADRWNTSDPDMLAKLRSAIMRDALPFLSEAATVPGIIRLSRQHPNPQDPYVQETIAYAWAYMDRRDPALHALREMEGHLDTTVPWQREMLDRAQLLQTALRADPPRARKLLDEWTVESIRNLGLADLLRAVNSQSQQAAQKPRLAFGSRAPRGNR